MNENKTVDLYRDTPVRYLGYANEVGEAFRSIIGTKWVNVTYGIATLYVLADTGHKSVKSYKLYIVHCSRQPAIQGFEDENINELNHKSKVAYTTTDTLIWQLLASVAIPGFAINRVCAFSYYLLQKRKSLPTSSRTCLVTVIGLTTIPFIIKPIDRFVDYILDESLRKFQPK